MTSKTKRATLDALIAEATVDAYDESEQLTGFCTMIDDCVELPFEATVLGVPVQVQAITTNEGGEVVAVCVRGKSKQAISLMDLPLPAVAPSGVEWIKAYRVWRSRG